MERNWFRELGLEKLAYMPYMSPGAEVGGGKTLQTIIPDFLDAGRPAGGTMATQVMATKTPLAAGNALTRPGAALKPGLLRRLFPKGSGTAGALGAMIPLGLLLASGLLSGGSGQKPAWAEMGGGVAP